jgi:hypothetical protein
LAAKEEQLASLGILRELTLENLSNDLIKNSTIELSSVDSIDISDGENLTSFTTVNKDGSKTIYTYNSPVKYVDKETGNIRFIDNELVSTGLLSRLFDGVAYRNKLCRCAATRKNKGRYKT